MIDYEVTDTHTKFTTVESDDGLIKPPYKPWAATYELLIT